MNEKMEFVDSHAHLDMEEFDQDRDEVIRRAFRGGIRAILCPADVTKAKSLETALEYAAKYGNFFAAAGVHPHQAKHFVPDYSQKIRELASTDKIKALGEIGLDFHYNFSSPEEQRKAFRAQLRLAQELALPVIIHSRNAASEVSASVQDEDFTRGGVLHCFTEDWDFARKMMDHNFSISFSGILTYPNAQPLREIAKKIPLEKLLIETDSPYLTPLPYRGIRKRNEPTYVVEIAKILAELKKVSLAEIAAQTSRNFYSLFVFEKKTLQC